MEQKDVDKIYKNLHENYEYRQGELIRKFDCKKSGAKKGKILGFFCMHTKNAIMRASIRIEGEIFSKPLSHFIYLFHYKKFPEVIEHINGNPVDCNIHNLMNTTRRAVESKKNGFLGYEEIETKNGVRYRVSITHNKNNSKRKIHLGSYNTKNEAHEIYKSAKEIFSMHPDEIQVKTKLKEMFPYLRIKLNKNKNNLPGVHRSGKSFKSSICINGKINYLGTFNSEIEANEAYLKAKKEEASQ